MGGFFGAISTEECVNDLFYGTDYNSHLGTKRAGMVTFDPERGFNRSIHSLERDYFRSRFEDELDQFRGKQGLGVISDTDPQPIIVNSHLGRYAVVTVAKINNLRQIADELLAQRMHFSEMSANNINQTELVALLINMGQTFTEGINMVYRKIEGSCSMLILTEDGIIAARDFLGRTPIVIGHKEGAYAVSSETCSFPNLDYKVVRDLGPGEIVRLKADSMEVMQPAMEREQVCAFLWVYYGFPASSYEGINVEAVREANGRMMGEQDETEVDCVCGVPDSGVGMALGYAEGFFGMLDADEEYNDTVRSLLKGAGVASWDEVRCPQIDLFPLAVSDDAVFPATSDVPIPPDGTQASVPVGDPPFTIPVGLHYRLDGAGGALTALVGALRSAD